MRDEGSFLKPDQGLRIQTIHDGSNVYVVEIRELSWAEFVVAVLA
jgi:hypothetical protein